jgi:hypothetical protein
MSDPLKTTLESASAHAQPLHRLGRSVGDSLFADFPD